MTFNLSTDDRSQSFLRVFFTLTIFKATSGFFDVLIEGSLMTKSDKNFLAFSIRIVDFKVQLFLRCKSNSTRSGA